MNPRRILALTLSLLLLASCGGGGSAPAGGGGDGGGSSNGPVGRIPPLDPGEAPEPDPAFEWRWFCSYPDSLSELPQYVVVRTQSEYDDVWPLMMHEPSLGPGMNPIPQQPEIDFEEEILVAVFLGNWQGHCTVAITNIVQVGDGARVEYEQYIGNPEPLAPYSRPYTSALLTRVEGEITFSGRIVQSGQ